jgi:hypothetical protein
VTPPGIHPSPSITPCGFVIENDPIDAGAWIAFVGVRHHVLLKRDLAGRPSRGSGLFRLPPFHAGFS